MPTRVLCFMLVPWEDFTSDDVFAFFNRFSGKCWSLVTSFLRLGYKQIHVCVVSGPLVLARCYIMKYAQDAAAWDHWHPRKMFWALSYAFFIMLVVFWWIKGRRCRKHIGSIVLTREFANTAPEARCHLWRIGRKLKKSRTLSTSRTYVFPGLPHRSFVRSHLPKVTPSCTWFFDAGVHRCCLSYTRQNITQSFPTILRDIQSSHTERVWSGPSALSLSNDCHLRGGKRMSQIPATFPRIPYAVDNCGLSCCLSSEKRARKSLVKSRSVGERIENFMVTWPNSQEQGTHAERADMETNRKADVVGSLTNVSTRWTLGTAMFRESGRLANAVFLRSFFTWFSWVTFRLRCFVRPQHRTF